MHFLARKLSGYETGWQATTGEQACVVWSVRRFHSYLFGVEFDIITDHKALLSMLHCQDTTGKLARWNMDLYPYDFKVYFRPGSELGNADGLFRTDKEIRAIVPDPSEIRAVAAMIQDATFPAAQQGASSSQALIPVNQEWETISDLEIAELVGLHLKADPPPGIGADMWTYFILDFRPGMDYQGCPGNEPSVAWQRHLAPPLLQLILKHHPDTVERDRQEQDFDDRYFLKTLEEILLRERLATVVARLYEVETLLDKEPQFWCDQLNSLKYLKGNCLSLFGVVEQYLMDWERLDFHNPAGYTQAYWLSDGGYWAHGHWKNGDFIVDLAEHPPEHLPRVNMTWARVALGANGSSSSTPVPKRSRTSPTLVVELDSSEDTEDTEDRDFMESDSDHAWEYKHSPDYTGGNADIVDLSETSVTDAFQWLADNQDATEEEKMEALNTNGRILYAEPEHLDALDDQLGVWGNPVLLSFLEFGVCPVNLSGQQKHKLLNRAQHYVWKPANPEDPPAERLRAIKKGEERVCPTPDYRKELFQRVHTASHQGPRSMLRVIQGQYFWNQMREDIREVVSQCGACQTSATLVTADRALHPIPVLPKGERWHLDLIGALKEGYGGCKYAVVAFDSCTKWPEARAIPNKSAEQVEAFFYEDIICRFPVKEVVCDNGTEFAGDFETMARDLGCEDCAHCGLPSLKQMEQWSASTRP